jgi:hypothetical protein
MASDLDGGLSDWSVVAKIGSKSTATTVSSRDRRRGRERGRGARKKPAAPPLSTNTPTHQHTHAHTHTHTNTHTMAEARLVGLMGLHGVDEEVQDLRREDHVTVGCRDAHTHVECAGRLVFAGDDS